MVRAHDWEEKLEMGALLMVEVSCLAEVEVSCLAEALCFLRLEVLMVIV